jgi:hypothetical protein
LLKSSVKSLDVTPLAAPLLALFCALVGDSFGVGQSRDEGNVNRGSA